MVSSSSSRSSPAIKFYSSAHFKSSASNVTLSPLPSQWALPIRTRPTSTPHTRQPQPDLRHQQSTRPPRSSSSNRKRERTSAPAPAPTPAPIAHEPLAAPRTAPRTVDRARRTDDRAVVANLLNELLDSEIRYVTDLKTLSTCIVDRLMELAEDDNARILTVEQARACFPDIRTILQLHQSLLEQLSEAINARHSTGQQVTKLCSILTRTIDAMRAPYTNYLAMFATSAHLLTRLRQTAPQLTAILDEIRSELGLEVGSMMILPVQRLPRYELFLGRLQQHIPNSRTITTTFNSITSLIHHINSAASSTSPLEDIQWNEYAGRVNLVAPWRTLLRHADARCAVEGAATFWARARGTASDMPVNIVLCNDVVVLGSKAASAAPLRLHHCMGLAGARISNLNEPNEAGVVNAFKVENGGSSMTILCDGSDDKRIWMGDFNDAIEKANEHQRRFPNAPQPDYLVKMDLTLSI